MGEIRVTYKDSSEPCLLVMSTFLLDVFDARQRNDLTTKHATNNYTRYTVGENNCTPRNKQPHTLQGGLEKLHNMQ